MCLKFQLVFIRLPLGSSTGDFDLDRLRRAWPARRFFSSPLPPNCYWKPLERSALKSPKDSPPAANIFSSHWDESQPSPV
jgi:hypothetical protein